MSRDPFRPQDPWAAEWQSERRLPGSGPPQHFTRGTALLWVVVIAILAVLYFVLPVQAFGVVALVLGLVLLSTLRV